MIELGLKLLMLLLSFYGYFLWIEKKGIDIGFAPVLTVSAIGVAMFFAGILNIMPLIARSVFLGGFLCLFFSMRHSLFTHPFQRTTGILALFGLVYVLLALRLRGETILLYDNFSHWLLVVRDILRNDALPNFESVMIEFQSYPTGTAGFLYYVCLVLGDTEGVILFGQTILLLSCVLVFWAFIQKPVLLSSLAAILCGVYLFVGNISILDLSVDSLLSLLGIALFAILVFYRHNTSLAAICCSVIGSYLLLVKNSGIFFLIIHATLLLLMDDRQTKTFWDPASLRKICRNLFFSLLIPLFVLLLWNRHVDYAYPMGNISKHSMTIANYTSVFGEKRWADICAIIQAFLSRLLTPGREGFTLLVLAGGYAAGFGIRRFLLGDKRRDALYYAGWSILVYISYLIGIAAMYLFSMPYAEAISLGSFDRYLSTVTMYLAGISCIYFLEQPAGAPPALSSRIVAVISMLLFLRSVPWGLTTLFSSAQDPSGTPRGTLQRICAEYDIQNHASYYLVGEMDYGYLYWMSRYEFWSPDVVTSQNPDASEFPDFYDRFDYLILMTENDASDQLLKDLGLPAGQKAYCLADYR